MQSVHNRELFIWEHLEMQSAVLSYCCLCARCPTWLPQGAVAAQAYGELPSICRFNTRQEVLVKWGRGFLAVECGRAAGGGDMWRTGSLWSFRSRALLGSRRRTSRHRPRGLSPWDNGLVSDLLSAVCVSPWGVVPSPEGTEHLTVKTQPRLWVVEAGKPHTHRHIITFTSTHAHRNKCHTCKPAHFIFVKAEKGLCSQEVQTEKMCVRKEKKGKKAEWVTAEGQLGAFPLALTGEINHHNYGPSE